MSSGRFHPASVFSFPFPSCLLFLLGKPDTDGEGCKGIKCCPKGCRMEPCVVLLPPGVSCIALQHIGRTGS